MTNLLLRILAAIGVLSGLCIGAYFYGHHVAKVEGDLALAKVERDYTAAYQDAKDKSAKQKADLEAKLASVVASTTAVVNSTTTAQQHAAKAIQSAKDTCADQPVAADILSGLRQ